MKDAVVTTITKAKGRKHLFHFTRVRNLPAIAHFDQLLASYKISPVFTGDRRLKPEKVSYHEYSITLNAHLRIANSMIDTSTTQEQFRACLDRHVFFWPTLRDCKKMMDTYARREPDEEFAVLEFDAHALLSDHYSTVKLSKYDSGSSPRFPTRCSYKKSLDMFLPLDEFKIVWNNLVPTKASEIREILIEGQVNRVSTYLKTVYVNKSEDVPESWRMLTHPLSELSAR
ncbi:hypothetical protein M5X11_26810 [Paenibacillus alginolyticus]|uniref:DarT domain-containing protein n=1 Tax=Paenibacillus alginolyticus TaxID=59839 RepID=A0ABT4G6E0_9BACL|nr:hypothetical protein [Paenibacillus alginolyticus]MCY9668495.1 hypothetical protein [Paenibacillus alginolyticus]MCY9691742.1 hypothetical protein [Paenibacillus alginolyticus]MEC0144093.1 hypothetical protein [Paenibacillus alginolyticus]